MQIRKIYIIIASLSILFAACKKDVLDKKPLDVLTEEDVWTDINLGTAYINQIYTELPGSIERDLDGATEIEDGNKDATHTYASGEVTPSNSPFSSSWYTYSVIARINKFLENFNPPAEDHDAAEVLRGEALFLRAFFYREMNDLFALLDDAEDMQARKLMK